MSDDTVLLKQLAAGLQQLGLDCSIEQQQTLVDYLRLLLKWNKAYNLTAIREPEAAVTKHLLDSLAVAPYLQGESIIDVGCGGGLPGVPLSLLYPEKSFTLLDSNRKKTQFLLHAKRILDLKNIQVVQQRVEKYQPEQPFSCVISRAFSAIDTMLTLCKHLCAADGTFLAMKGVYPTQELAGLPSGFRVENSIQLTIPDLDEQRHLICLMCD